jgi:1-acyl-sn-glycerol-3-phosphate acyltransferase
MNNDDKFIDIEKAIHSKNPKLLKWLPKFILRYIKKIVHEDEINQILLENIDNYGYDFCKDVINRFNIKVTTKGTENIPKNGGYIFVANHPLGGMDAMAIVTTVAPIRNDIKFIVNDLLLNLKNLKGQFVGVNKHGGNTKESLNMVDELFASDNAVFIFPAGLVSRKNRGLVEDLEWKKTFITRAKKHNKTIIPLYVEGKLTNFFYRLSNYRTKIGIKSNIEMFYLVDECFKQKNKHLKIIFGESVPPSRFDKSKTDKEWAEWMKKKVYNLKPIC